mmetsp:Transcript_9777/g.24362  ORF Transcript_9777/g.24362 Transcript_9777/m.24362 type:complete len:222 (-) Transcript_9777:3-668(-)
MGKGMGMQRNAGIAMRICIAFFLVIGILFIIFGCMLQNPPRAYAPGMFVAVGSFNLFAALVGFWGSYNKKRALLVFLGVGGFSTILQIVLFVTLLTVFDKVVEAIKKASQMDDVQEARLGKQLNWMRWVLVAFLFVELLTLVLAILLKWVIKDDDNTYRGFDDEANEQRMLAMGTLRSDIERGGERSERPYDKIRQKMSLKYGAVAGAAASWKSKMALSWQ